MKYINELREGDNVSEIYLCKKKDMLQTKAGKNYLSLILQDKTGTVDGKVWDLNGGINHFESMDFIKVEAQVVSFQGNLQMNIKRIRKADEGEYVVGDYMPTTSKDQDEMYRELLRLVDSVEDKNYHALLDGFFRDKEFAIKFRDHSAAKSIHHGFIGGLLEHSLSVAKLCEFYTKQYPILNHDLLITAALLHDIGKLEELSLFPENDYTDDGQLLGHIVIGANMVDRAMDKIEGFPKIKRTELIHCVLAHHGELEYGSPKKPALIEAVALSFADNTDAKIETFAEAIYGANMAGTEWLGFNRALDSNIRGTSK